MDLSARWRKKQLWLLVGVWRKDWDLRHPSWAAQTWMGRATVPGVAKVMECRHFESRAGLFWGFSHMHILLQGRWPIARQLVSCGHFSISKGVKHILFFSWLISISICLSHSGKATSSYNQYLSDTQFLWQHVGLVALPFISPPLPSKQQFQETSCLSLPETYSTSETYRTSLRNLLNIRDITENPRGVL